MATKIPDGSNGFQSSPSIGTLLSFIIIDDMNHYAKYLTVAPESKRTLASGGIWEP